METDTSFHPRGIRRCMGFRVFIHSLGISVRRLSLYLQHNREGTLGIRGSLHGFSFLRLSFLLQFLRSSIHHFPSCRFIGQSDGFRDFWERRSWEALLLGAFLFMLLDIVIDPVALLGDRWFLGKIYGYRHAGIYFGIPMSNFGGWFLVGAAMIGTLSISGRDTVPGRFGGAESRRFITVEELLGPLLYFSVLLFNIAVTFRIGEYLLAFVDVVILSSFLVPLAFFTIYKTRHISPEYIAAFMKNSRASEDVPRSIALDSNAMRGPAEALVGSGEESR